MYLCASASAGRRCLVSIDLPVGGLHTREGTWIPSREYLPAAATVNLLTLCTSEHALYQTSCV